MAFMSSCKACYVSALPWLLWSKDMPEIFNNHAQTAELLLFPGCDPKNRLSDLFESNQIQGKPELAILDWLVALPTAIDPAFAAKSVLIKLDSDRTLFSSDQKNIVTLLAEIACHPREKLFNPASKYSRGQRRRLWLKQTQERTVR